MTLLNLGGGVGGAGQDHSLFQINLLQVGRREQRGSSTPGKAVTLEASCAFRWGRALWLTWTWDLSPSVQGRCVSDPSTRPPRKAEKQSGSWGPPKALPRDNPNARLDSRAAPIMLGRGRTRFEVLGVSVACRLGTVLYVTCNGKDPSKF